VLTSEPLKMQAIKPVFPNLCEEKNDEVAALRKSTLATGWLWSLTELFRFFWQETDAVGGRAFFESWHAWSIRRRLDPIRKVARMLKTRLDRILTWFVSPIRKAVAEGFNSRIQSIKSAARGFRLFEHYRIRILFYCGKLSLKPRDILPRKSQNNELSREAFDGLLCIQSCKHQSPNTSNVAFDSPHRRTRQSFQDQRRFFRLVMPSAPQWPRWV
jgi:hypothetical protein